MNQEVSQIRTGTILSYVNLGIGNLIPLVYTPIMLHMLGKSEYGLYTLANSVVGYLSLLSFGIGGTIVRYLAKARAEGDREEERRIIGLFLKIYSVLALLVLAGGFLIMGKLELFFGAKISAANIGKMRILVAMMAVNTALTFPTSVFASIITAHERFIFSKLIAMLSTVLAPCLNIVMLYCGFGSVGMTAAATVLTVITFLCNGAYCFRKLQLRPSWERTESGLLKEIAGFSAFIFLGEVVNMLYWATDKVLLGAMIGEEAVAVYNVGAMFNTVMQSLGTGVGSLFAPRIVQKTVDGDREYLNDLMIRIGRLQFYIIALILTGFITFGRPFIALWAGAEYAEAYWVALLVMVPVSVPLIQSIALQIIVAQNRHRFRAVAFLGVAVLNVIGTVLLIPHYGIVGAALATCAAYLIGPVFLMNWYYARQIGLDIRTFWRSIGSISVLPALLLLCGLAVCRFVALSGWPALLLGIAVYTALYCILAWRFCMDAYEKSIFTQLGKRLLRK